MKRLRTSCIRRADRPAAVCAVLLLCLLALAAVSLCIGVVPLSPVEVVKLLAAGDRSSVPARILLYSRLPRTCASVLAGGALAVSGVIIQTVLANPLASPSVVGVNAGAGLCVTICCAVLPVSVYLTPAAAFLGALLTSVLVLSLGEATGASRLTLILAGVAISNLFSAAIDAVVTFVPEALNGYSDFKIGGFSNVTMTQLRPVCVLILVSLLAALSLSRQMDLLGLGTETAQSLGLPVRRVRFLLLVLASALAGAAVSFSGLLGFVGLIVPNCMRRLLGEESLPLMVSSALAGACLVTLCDVMARTLFSPYELPVGIVLAFVGVPFFLWLLFLQKGKHPHD